MFFLQKESGTGIVTAKDLPTLSFWSRVDQVQLLEEHENLYISFCPPLLYTLPPKTNRSPCTSTMVCPIILFGRGGPNASKNKNK